MKKILLLALAVAILPNASMAFQYGNSVPFSMYSATSGTAVKSAAYNVRGFKVKTVTVQGVAIAGHTDAALSGTVLVECGPTASGPWTTCNQSQSSAGADVTTTANDTITWMDANAYIRASWAKTAGLVKVWLNWTE